MKNRGKRALLFLLLALVSGGVSFGVVNNYYPIMYVSPCAVLFAFSLYGLYLVRYKPSTKWFVAITIVSNFLLLILYIYRVFGLMHIDTFDQIVYLCAVGAAVQAAVVVVTVLIRFVYRRARGAK